MSGPDPTHRLLGVADTDDVLAVLAASDLAAVGFVDVTRDDVVADLRRPDLEAYGWYDAGRLVGYACASRTEDSNQVEVDAYVHPEHDPELGHDLLEFLEDRARALVAEVGHDEPWLGLGVYRQDLRSQEWVRRAGYETRTTFTRMRIDLDSYGAPRRPTSWSAASTPRVTCGSRTRSRTSRSSITTATCR